LVWRYGFTVVAEVALELEERRFVEVVAEESQQDSGCENDAGPGEYP
jgi:hypothetical protein